MKIAVQSPPDKGDLGGVFAGVFLKNIEITTFSVNPINIKNLARPIPTLAFLDNP